MQWVEKMSFEAEVFVVLASIVAACIPWAFSIHAKVSVIAHSVEMLPELVRRLEGKLDQHEDRLDRHEQEIQALKTPPRPGG